MHHLLSLLPAGYVLLFAPRKLGWRGEMRLVAAFGADNAVAFALVNLLGFFPAILGCVAWPLLRSAKHKVRHFKAKPLAAAMIAAFQGNGTLVAVHQCI
jgi:hypothetical protein